MGILKAIRGSLKRLNIESWQELTSADQLGGIESSSFNKPTIVFKHSTTCGLSAAAKHRLEEGWTMFGSKVDFYYLDLLAYRSVSNLVANKFEVTHQSPQVILINNGKAIYHSSHHAVQPGIINNWLESL